MNSYGFTLLRKSDGASLVDDGMMIVVYTEKGMVAARDQVLYENRRQGWKSVPKLIDVKLDTEVPNGLGPSIWIIDTRLGLGLAL